LYLPKKLSNHAVQYATAEDILTTVQRNLRA